MMEKYATYIYIYISACYIDKMFYYCHEPMKTSSIRDLFIEHKNCMDVSKVNQCVCLTSLNSFIF